MSALQWCPHCFAQVEMPHESHQPADLGGRQHENHIHDTRNIPSRIASTDMHDEHNDQHTRGDLSIVEVAPASPRVLPLTRYDLYGSPYAETRVTGDWCKWADVDAICTHLRKENERLTADKEMLQRMVNLRDQIAAGLRLQVTDAFQEVARLQQELETSNSICADLRIACEAALHDRIFKDWPEIAMLLMVTLKKASKNA